MMMPASRVQAKLGMSESVIRTDILVRQYQFFVGALQSSLVLFLKQKIQITCPQTDQRLWE